MYLVGLCLLIIDGLGQTSGVDKAKLAFCRYWYAVAAPSAGRTCYDWNLPQLELAADQDLVKQLKDIGTVAGLKGFIHTWARDRLPALLDKHGLRASMASPARGKSLLLCRSCFCHCSTCCSVALSVTW